MTGRPPITRRSFLRRAAVAAAAGWVAPCVVPSSIHAAEGKAAPSERITVGMIGVGRQTVYYNLKAFLESPDTQVVALCDVDAWRLKNALATVEKHYAGEKSSGKFKGCSVYRDFQELLARKDVDAVMISTPDHWHVPMSIAAVTAGKDVCCEKPLTRTIAEGRLLSDTVTKHNRVFRTDSEFRSIPYFHRACELVRNGRIGRLKTIRSGVPMEYDPGDLPQPPQPEMPHIDLTANLSSAIIVLEKGGEPSDVKERS